MFIPVKTIPGPKKPPGLRVRARGAHTPNASSVIVELNTSQLILLCSVTKNSCWLLRDCYLVLCKRPKITVSPSRWGWDVGHSEEVWFPCPRWGKGRSWHILSFHLKLHLILSGKGEGPNKWTTGRREKEQELAHACLGGTNRVLELHLPASRAERRKHQFLAKMSVLCQSRVKAPPKPPLKRSVSPAQGDPKGPPSSPLSPDAASPVRAQDLNILSTTVTFILRVKWAVQKK